MLPSSNLPSLDEFKAGWNQVRQGNGHHWEKVFTRNSHPALLVVLGERICICFLFLVITKPSKNKAETSKRGSGVLLSHLAFVIGSFEPFFWLYSFGPLGLPECGKRSIGLCYCLRHITYDWRRGHLTPINSYIYTHSHMQYTTYNYILIRFWHIERVEMAAFIVIVCDFEVVNLNILFIL